MSTPPTLLLADDSVTIQRVVALTFADQPVRLVVAKDGQDAINRMATERPDVVLADTNMPCVDGYEVAKWVRQQPHLCTVPVLLLAGATDPVDEQRLHDSGANGVLEKPFEPTHVISRVKELLGMKAAAPAAPTGRLLTPPDARTERRPSAPAEPAGPVPAGAPAAPLPAVAAPASGSAEAPLDDIFAAYDARQSAQDPPGGTSAVAAAGDRADLGDRPASDARDWFSEARAAGEGAEGSGLGFYTGPEPVQPVQGGVGVVAVDTAPRAAASVPTVEASADVFASLLAAEQGDATAIDRQRRAAAQMTDEMLGALAGKVVERLQPETLRDELQRALGTSLRDTVKDTVRDSVATETRAAVAEAVQAAVDGSLVGAVRGALNEAVTMAVPPAVASAVAQGVSARVDAAVNESVSRALPAAIERAVQEFVLSRITVLVRDTVERELRASIGALIQESARDVVRETSERLVREEIAKIRGGQRS